jgi:5-(aminomethyl)-3-furanmethanol phosphate kinase
VLGTDVSKGGLTRPTSPSVDTVVKVGGGVLAHAEYFAAALATIAAAARGQRLLLVPGGGPFADTVRDVDRRMALSDAAAHWMAVLAMEQYAHLIATQVAGAMLAENPREIVAAFKTDLLPVLAPYRWLRAADPLPHSWNVTSDSIAAWISGVVGARRLVLVKPPAIHRDRSSPAGKDESAPDALPGGDLLDTYFHRALPAHVTPVVVQADELDRLRAALDHGS